MCFAMIDRLGVSKRRKLRARRQWRIHHCSILPLDGALLPVQLLRFDLSFNYGGILLLRIMEPACS